MILQFNDSGMLPEGIHWADLTEVQSRFGGNPHRGRLLSGLERALKALQLAGCSRVYLDGSFVTAKDFPGDYDACWDMKGVNSAALDPVFSEFDNKRIAQKVKFFGEFFPAHLQVAPASPYRTILDFFQTDKLTGKKKGIVGINFTRVL